MKKIDILIETVNQNGRGGFEKFTSVSIDFAKNRIAIMRQSIIDFGISNDVNIRIVDIDEGDWQYGFYAINEDDLSVIKVFSANCREEPEDTLADQMFRLCEETFGVEDRVGLLQKVNDDNSDSSEEEFWSEKIR